MSSNASVPASDGARAPSAERSVGGDDGGKNFAADRRANVTSQAGPSTAPPRRNLFGLKPLGSMNTPEPRRSSVGTTPIEIDSDDDANATQDAESTQRSARKARRTARYTPRYSKEEAKALAKRFKDVLQCPREECRTKGRIVNSGDTNNGKSAMVKCMQCLHKFGGQRLEALLVRYAEPTSIWCPVAADQNRCSPL